MGFHSLYFLEISNFKKSFIYFRSDTWSWSSVDFIIIKNRRQTMKQRVNWKVSKVSYLGITDTNKNTHNHLSLKSQIYFSHVSLFPPVGLITELCWHLFRGAIATLCLSISILIVWFQLLILTNAFPISYLLPILIFLPILASFSVPGMPIHPIAGYRLIYLKDWIAVTPSIFYQIESVPIL